MEYTIYYENKPIQIYWKISTKKWKFSDKNSDVFFFFFFYILLKT